VTTEQQESLEPLDQTIHSTDRARKVEVFRQLHASDCFAMPNPHDLGACRLLESLGFSAIATTSAGFANSLGRLDMNITRDQLVQHVRLLCENSKIPLNVDAERCFPDDEGGIAQTIQMVADAGAAGCSIEDWNPVDQRVEPIEVASAKVAAAAAAARSAQLVLTARAENNIRGVQDFDDTLRRLLAYRDAGADVLYAPGLTDLQQISTVVRETQLPLNVLLLPGGPSVEQLAGVGVRRVSIGSSLSSIAYGAFAAAALRIMSTGSLSTEEPFLPKALAQEAFRQR
jgi:2-methylisocitrate lyase-like PEP mutase family enzyme